MSIAYLDYPLENGFVHNWLVVGPHAALVSDLDCYTGTEYKLQIARHYYQPESGIGDAPAEMQPITIADLETRWEYVRCRDDHFVDLSLLYHNCHYLRAWAYTELVSQAEQRVTCILTTNGPANVWLDGIHIHRQEHFCHQLPKRVEFGVTLRPGPNRILVHFEQVAVRECPYVMALQVVAEGAISNQDLTGGAADVLAVRLPTTVTPVGRRLAFERAFGAVSIRQDVFKADDEVAVYWPDDFDGNMALAIRVQTPGGSIYSEGNKTARAGARAVLGEAFQFPDGAYDLFFMPRPQEYYLGNMRVERKIRCWLTRNRFSTAPYGDLGQRCHEALVDAALRKVNVFSEIAKMALGAWDRVDPDAVRDTIERINRRGDQSPSLPMYQSTSLPIYERCCDEPVSLLTGLLGMIYRYGQAPAFPQELAQPLQDSILGFKYWLDEPGNPADQVSIADVPSAGCPPTGLPVAASRRAGSDAVCYTTESHSILFHTCELLAGQLYPDQVFTSTGETGEQHRAKGEQRARAWLADRAAHGFTEWDSNCYFEEDALALSHLLSLADDDEVAALATVVLDKLLFTMAANSFKGVFGSTHGRTYAPFIKSGYNEATSGISRLLWGMGAFNSHVLGTVSLACSDYELPTMIAEIAADLPEEMWNRERHAGERWDQDSGKHSVEVNKVTYKTPDYMLCSAQDWHPGEKGYQQHIWQATFGPEAVVFVTHPACASEDGAHRPNFWQGNATLPRVAQWKDLLIAVHNLPGDDWMGFTHAFFPAFAFDEYYLQDGWAFARKDDGYLALTAAQGLTWMTTGDNAYREIRSYGGPNIWLCQLGRRALDDSFEAFRQKIQALRIEFDDLAVRLRSLRGEGIAFGWRGPLRLNGAEQPITGFKHYENPYCVADLPAAQMEITFHDTMMRLQFA